MNYSTTKEIALKWGVSERRVQVLCEHGRIDGVFRLGNAWAIPSNARKPGDSRKRVKEYDTARITASHAETSITDQINDPQYNLGLAEKNLERQDRLLCAVNIVASLLISDEQSEFISTIHESLSILGHAAEVDRVYIWENFTKDGELYCSQIYEWSEGAEPQQGTRYAVNIKYDDSIPTWKDAFIAGNSINGIVKNMCQAERNQLEPQGIVSILVLPIIIQNELLGFIGFDDCRNERFFSETEENILRSGGLLIASAMMRNQMTALIKDTAARMEAVLKNYAGVIWSVNKDGTITLFRGLYLNKIGVKPEFIEGKNLRTALGKNRHLDIIRKVEETFTEGSQDWISEIDGAMFRCHTTPMYDESGNVTGVVGSIDDITDSVKLQKELETAVEAAQSASNAKSNFLSNMSHEMRTPMNAIIGMTVIGKAAKDIDQKDYAFGKIEGASSHLLGVINDILDMSKIEASKFELSCTEFCFEKMLQKVVNVISFRVDEKKLLFSISIDSEIPRYLISDDQRLSQVITNLLSNAVKFTSEGGSIHLSALLISKEESTCTIKIEVSDTGIGITSQQQAKLFSSFMQAESSTSRKFGGTGLGLAISKHIVDMMEGEIWVESVPGEGSNFIFTVTAGYTDQSAPSMLLPGVSLKNIHVLAVDDDPETLDYFTKIASQLDINCDTATSGEAALGMIERCGGYDIYFIDWKMPGMDGIELSANIKSHGFKHAVIIMISAAEWNDIRNNAISAGVDGFLPKPLLPGAVADCINKMLGEESDVSENAVGIESFSGYCALLVEDLDINREIVLALFKPSDLEIDCATNGLEAVRLFKKNPDKYDVIFMDVQMPEMDGYEATRQIRALGTPWAKNIPIIAMTANVFKEDIEGCIECGMNDHVAKPLDFDEIVGKLHKYMKRNGGSSRADVD